MTEYKNSKGSSITEVKDRKDFDDYFFKAVALCKNDQENTTFLPITGKLGSQIAAISMTPGFGGEKEVKARQFVMRKTFEKTFEHGNPEIDNDLIINCAGRYARETASQKLNNNYPEMIKQAINSQVGKNKEWFSRLSPSAQLLAIVSDPSLDQQKGVNLNMDRDVTTSQSDLENVFHVVYDMTFKKNKTTYRQETRGLTRKRDIKLGRPTYRDLEKTTIEPVTPSPVSWEVRAAALEAGLKSGRSLYLNEQRYVFDDLLKTVKTPEQLAKLTGIMGEYGRTLQPDSISKSLQDIPAFGETTEKFLFTAMKLDKEQCNITGSDVSRKFSLPHDHPNYSALSAAKIDFLKGTLHEGVLKDMERINDGPVRKGVEQGKPLATNETTEEIRKNMREIKSLKAYQDHNR